MAAGLAGLTLLLWPGSAAAHYSTAIVAPDDATGPSGRQLDLHGLMHAEPGPVSLRWDSVLGPAIGVVVVAPDRHSFTATVTIPPAAPGVYTIVLVAGDQKLATTPFEVTSASARRSPGVSVASSGSGSSSRWPILAAPLGVAAAALPVLLVWRRRRPG